MPFTRRRVRATTESLYWPKVNVEMRSAARLSRRVDSGDTSATMRDALVASVRARSIPRAPLERTRDELDDAVQRHRMHLGEVETRRVDPQVASALPRRGEADVGEARHLLDVAAEAQAGR